MASTVTNPDLLRWLQSRNAFGGQYGSPNQGTQVASLAPSASQQNNINSGLFYNTPETSGQTRVDNFGSGINPYPEPGPATLTGGFNRWLGRAGGENLDHLRPPGWGDNPASSFMAKYDPRWEGRPRTGGLSGFGDATMMTFGGQIPGAGLFLGASKLFNQLGAHHDYNPARDSNLFYETDRGRITYDSMDPGGGGEQMGSLNAYNMLMAIAENDPDREIQTEHGWIKVGDLAELMKNRPMGQLGHEGPAGQYPTQGFSKTPTTFDQQTYKYSDNTDSNMTNEEALRSLATRSGNAWNDVASQLNPDGTEMGYNEQVAAAAKAEQMLRGQRDSTKLVPQETSAIAATTDGDQSVVNTGDKSRKMDAKTSHMEAMDLGLDMGRGWRGELGSDELMDADMGSDVQTFSWPDEPVGTRRGGQEVHEIIGPDAPLPNVRLPENRLLQPIESPKPLAQPFVRTGGRGGSLGMPSGLKSTSFSDVMKRVRGLFSSNTTAVPPQSMGVGPNAQPMTLPPEEARADIHNTVIQIESGGNKDAKGSATERGEYQVKESTLKKPGYGIKPLDPKKDVKEERTRVGKEYLDKMLDIFSDYKNPVATALVAFNKGPGFAKNWADRGSNLFELQGQAIGYLQKFHDANPDYITIGTGKELTPSGSEMSLPDIVELPPQLKKPTPLSVFVDTTSSDPVDDAWDSGDFGFSPEEMSFDGII